jgi:HEAT repeat protein
MDTILRNISPFSPRQVINPLISFFYHENEQIRWRAITAAGFVVSGMAETGQMEPARVIMRRFMWSLNDESGGIGWGAPEAMGEIMARNAAIAEEFHRILTSYAWEQGNFLEHEILQRGVLWGIGRLSHARPALIPYAAPYLLPFITSSDPFHRGLAAWALVPIADDATKHLLKDLSSDTSEIRVFLDGNLVQRTVASLAVNLW